MRGFAELRPWLAAGPVLCAALLDARSAPAAHELFLKLRAALVPIGALPVVVGGPDEQEAIAERVAGRDAPHLAAELGADRSRNAIDGARLVDLEVGEFPDAPAAGVRREPFAFFDEAKGRVGVAILPTSDFATVPVYLGRHGLASVLAYWSVRHGPLEVVFCGEESLELEVARPAMTPPEVKLLACEVAAVAPSIVEDGHGSLGALAKHLLGNARWHLWWRV